MPELSDQELDAWITSRKENPSAHLVPSVMKEIKKETHPPSRHSLESEYPSWLISTGCLFAGLGKIGLIVHLAF